MTTPSPTPDPNLTPNTLPASPSPLSLNEPLSPEEADFNRKVRPLGAFIAGFKRRIGLVIGGTAVTAALVGGIMIGRSTVDGRDSSPAATTTSTEVVPTTMPSTSVTSTTTGKHWSLIDWEKLANQADPAPTASTKPDSMVKPKTSPSHQPQVSQSQAKAKPASIEHESDPQKILGEMKAISKRIRFKPDCRGVEDSSKADFARYKALQHKYYDITRRAAPSLYCKPADGPEVINY